MGWQLARAIGLPIPHSCAVLMCYVLTQLFDLNSLSVELAGQPATSKAGNPKRREDTSSVLLRVLCG
jgi:hypothetical protein